MVKIRALGFCSMLLMSSLALGQGALENPAPSSTESGIGVISGWHCSASKVEAVIDGRSVGSGFVGSPRGDTAGVCGKTATGFAILFNYNLLSRGAHTITLLADGTEFASTTFNSVQSGGAEFLSGVNRQATVNDFPSAGATATLTWNQAKQGFVITNIQGGAASGNRVGLEKLYGDVTLNYKFNTSTTVYTDHFSFSSSSLNSEGMLISVVRNRSANVACSKVDLDREFVCLIAPTSGGEVDLFYLDVNSTGAISGAYQYCRPINVQYCSALLEVSPSGVVSGIVRGGAAATAAIRSSGDDGRRSIGGLKAIESEIEDAAADEVRNGEGVSAEAGEALIEILRRLNKGGRE